MLFFAWYSLIITFNFNFVFRRRSTPPLCCEFDNERAPLVCCRDNVNKYANYTPSSIQMNLCGSLKFCSKPTRCVIPAKISALHIYDIKRNLNILKISKWCTNKHGFMSGNFCVEPCLWRYELEARETGANNIRWNFVMYLKNARECRESIRWCSVYQSLLWGVLLGHFTRCW